FFHPRSPRKEYSHFECALYIPEQTAQVSLCIVSVGAGKLSVDDIEAVAEKTDGYKPSSLAYSLAAEPQAVLWHENPSTRVPAGISDKLLRTLNKKDKIEIFAAKGEYEPFQLVMTPLRDFQKVFLEFTDLKSRNGEVLTAQEHIYYNPVAYVDVRKATNNLNILGLIPDPLPPVGEVKLQKGRNQPFWITVRVPRSFKSGKYKGSIKLMTEKGLYASIPLELTVWDFEIPEKNPLKTLFLFNEYWAQRFDKRPLNEIKNDFYNNFKAHRIAGTSTFYRNHWPECEVKDKRLKINSFVAFDAFFEPIKKYDFNTRYHIPGIGRPRIGGFSCGRWADNSGWKGFPLLSPEFNKYFSEYCRLIGKHLQEKGLLDQAFAYVYDEPLLGNYSKVRKLGEIIKKAFPEIKNFITEQPEPGLIGPFDIWCCSFPGSFSSETIKPRKNKGEEIWGYNYPMSLELSLTAHRVYTWQAYLAELKGLLLWNVNNWRNPKISPWTDPTPRANPQDVTTAGGAVALYPHPDGIGRLVNSIRWENVREAMEDYAYLWLLEKTIDKAKKELSYNGYAARRRVAELVSPLLKNIYEYHDDAAILLKVRNNIANEILEVNKQPLLLLESNLPESTPLKVNSVTLNGKVESESRVSIGGRPVPVSDGYFRQDISLTPGNNRIEIAVERDGQKKVIYRNFIAGKDKNLELFRQKLSAMRRQGVNVSSYEKLLARSRKRYGKEESVMVANALEELNKKEFQSAIAQAKAFQTPNSSYKVLLAELEHQYKIGNMNKTASYLAQLEKLKTSSGTTMPPCKLEIIKYHSHLGYRLKNSVLDVLILESGGRITEFKVNGVPTLHVNTVNLDNDYPESVRCDWNKLKNKSWIDIGGYEDWGEWKWLLGHMDWNCKIEKLSPAKLSLSASVDIPETLTPGAKFKLKRLMTLEAGKPYLKISYVISNPAPKSDRYYQQDLYQYNFHWRAHTEFSIGKSPENDSFIIPAPKKLRCPEFSFAKPERLEKFYSLNKNYVGAYDKLEKTGIFYILPPSIKDVLLFYNSFPGGCYNLEVFKSRTKGLANCEPFNILPGESVTFDIYLIGIDADNIEAAKRKVEQFAGELK
ncbi:MAG: glycoside hydrolase domain-containing protein, partial [Victivallales bacterium]